MRRDLHDGLGPTLTGIAYSADAAANLVASDADAAVRLLRELRARRRRGDRRGAPDRLRPAAEGARRAGPGRRRPAAASSTCTRPAGGCSPSTSTRPTTLPELSAAVEVAAYRVAVEAVTNVARHAGGRPRRTVTFALADAGQLRVRVADAGSSARPVAARRRPGRDAGAGRGRGRRPDRDERPGGRRRHRGPPARRPGPDSPGRRRSARMGCDRRTLDRPERQDAAAGGRPRAGGGLPPGDRPVRRAGARPRARPHLPADPARPVERPRRRARRRAGRRRPARVLPLPGAARAAGRRRRDDGPLRPAAAAQAPRRTAWCCARSTSRCWRRCCGARR